MLKPLQTTGISIMPYQAMTMPKQASTVPMQVSAAQTNGIDISSLMNMMIPVMMIGMVMKMMTGAMGTAKSKA